MGLIPFQRGWDIIDLSVGLIIRCVGLKLNCGGLRGAAYMGLYIRGRRLRIPIFIVGFDELN